MIKLKKKANGLNDFLLKRNCITNRHRFFPLHQDSHICSSTSLGMNLYWAICLVLKIVTKDHRSHHNPWKEFTRDKSKWKEKHRSKQKRVWDFNASVSSLVNPSFQTLVAVLFPRNAPPETRIKWNDQHQFWIMYLTNRSTIWNCMLSIRFCKTFLSPSIGVKLPGTSFSTVANPLWGSLVWLKQIATNKC